MGEYSSNGTWKLGDTSSTFEMTKDGTNESENHVLLIKLITLP